MTPRRAAAADHEAVVQTLTLAFAKDPVWRPTLTRPGGDPSAMRPFWEIWVGGAMRYDWVWLFNDGAAREGSQLVALLVR
jgi:hypothetical protein